MASNKPLPRTALEPVCETLAEVIRQRRAASGLSLNRLAQLTNLSHPMIRFIENSERIPTIDTIARISRAFGVSCSKLLAEAENKLKL
jgi:transcriptional regulator with XRE-family HTH domain